MLRKTMIRTISVLGLSLGIFAAPSFAQAPAGTTLDKANMQQFFANMGYDVKKLDDTMYSFPANTGKYNVGITAGISSNGQFLWLTSTVAMLPDSGPLPADLLEATLKANDEIGPAEFFIRTCSDCAAGSKRQLRISMPLSNHELTPAIVHRAIDTITGSINDTAQVWASTAWNPAIAKK
jgi:hypothetical protein